MTKTIVLCCLSLLEPLPGFLELSAGYTFWGDGEVESQGWGLMFEPRDPKKEEILSGFKLFPDEKTLSA